MHLQVMNVIEGERDELIRALRLVNAAAGETCNYMFGVLVEKSHTTLYTL